MKMTVLWVVAPYSLVEVYRRFKDVCCPHNQGDRPTSTRLHGTATPKTAIFLRKLIIQERNVYLLFIIIYIAVTTAPGSS
jgi:hypothetical protein